MTSGESEYALYRKRAAELVQGPEWVDIPQHELDRGYKGMLHVRFWRTACVFHHVKTVNGLHHLVTPMRRKKYTTYNALVYTKKNKPNNATSNSQTA